MKENETFGVEFPMEEGAESVYDYYYNQDEEERFVRGPVDRRPTWCPSGMRHRAVVTQCIPLHLVRNRVPRGHTASCAIAGVLFSEG